MNVGLYFDLRNPEGWRRDWRSTYSDVLEHCHEVERLGGDSVWFSEHHGFDDGYLSQPLTLCAAVAACTTRVRLGTAVLLAPFRSGRDIAEQGAIIDLLSGGRLELGLGAGYRRSEFEAFGADFTRRFETTETTITEIQRIWRDPFQLPRPQQTEPPLWLGYQGPKGAFRAGSLGVGLLSLDPSLTEPYERGRESAGRQAGARRRAGVINAYISDDPERDWPAVKKHLAYQVASYLEHAYQGTGRPVPALDPDRWRARGLGAGMNHFLLATPADAATQLTSHLKGMDVDTVFFWASIGGMPAEMVQRQIELVCTRLRPMLADALVATPSLDRPGAGRSAHDGDCP